ncbi:MAG TPA: hypothetical protein VKB26_12560 [Candidatus Acidoferrales bacterium]|nr:hypothetical protein [Candidatus Acidoferrales bacterium]
MKRSGDVTASAIILFFGSGLLVLLMLLGILGATLASAPPAARVGQFLALAFYFVFAAWGIVTAVGILSLRPWARISMIVLSTCAILGCLCASAGIFVAQRLITDDPQMPPAAGKMLIIVFGIVLFIPLGVAIWWLILFTRKRVVTEFTNGGAGALPVAPDSPILSSTAFQFAAVPSAPQIPLSIRIIAVLYLIFGAFTLLASPYSIRSGMPTLILGKVFESWPGWTFLMLIVFIQVVLCVAILKKRTWALDGLIACVVFAAANTVLFLVTPSRAVFWERIIQAQSLPPNVSAATMESMMKTIMPISMVSGVVLSLVCLYFLITRRKMFRNGCASRPEAAQ